MKYRIGQKVVYIGPDYTFHPLIVGYSLIVPAPNEIYTIRGGMLLPPPYEPEDGYLLREIVNKPGRCGLCGLVMELHINERFLRPLIARKNDGEAFVAGLRPLLKAVGRPKVTGGILK